MITPLTPKNDRVLGFKMSGTLHDEDYKQFVPTVESAIKRNGKVRLLAKYEDFHGWDMHAMWDDIKFTANHYADVERICMIGDHTWEKWMTYVCRPFTGAKVRYFDQSQSDEAWRWVTEPTGEAVI